jgi:serine/threonine protein kinase
MKAHIGQEYDNVGNWRRETKALKVFNGLHNQHTVRGIGAFTQRGKYFILMEWADSGDLEDVWEKTPHPQLNLTATRVAQFLEQFRGLANTLNQMHDYKVESDNSVVIPKNEETEAGSAFGDTKSAEAAGDGLPPHDKKVHFETPQVKIEINEPSGGTENWRHGDLKPGNILSFTEGHSSCWLGTLKLADLGRAKQHMDKTGKRVGTSEMFSTLPYDPLEVWTNLSRGRSRLVDLWSFGCVLLESVIWLMFGLDELCKFKSRTTGIGSLYWTVESIHNRTAKLNELTFEWLDRLLKDDPECRASKRGSAMRDLILLIKKRLLLIELPTDSEVYEEGRRINSKLLVQELDDIIQKGTQDRLYLFSGFSRSDIAAPEIAQVPGVIEQEKNQYLSPDVNLSAANVAQNKASTPWQARYVNDSYLHDFDDKWQYVDDTSFTSKIIHRLDIGINRLLPEHVSSLCGRCETLDFSRADIKIKWSLAELRTRARNLHCEFCALLLRTADKSPNKDSVEFDKFSSGLRMNRTPGLPALTIRRTAGRFNISCIVFSYPKLTGT